jgi:hypothetical protein
MGQLSGDLNRVPDTSLFADVIHFRCPATLPTAIRQAAKLRMISAMPAFEH